MSLFQNNTKSMTKKADDQVVRVDMEKDDISGRKSHLPKSDKGGDLSIQHVGKSNNGMR